MAIETHSSFQAQAVSRSEARQLHWTADKKLRDFPGLSRWDKDLQEMRIGLWRMEMAASPRSRLPRYSHPLLRERCIPQGNKRTFTRCQLP